MNALCPFCGHGTEPVTRAPDRNWRVDDAVFEVRRCTACDYRYTANPPADIGRYYTGGHYSRPAMAKNFEAYLPAERYKLEMLRRLRPSGSLMEIGPSMGAFCHLAKQAGYDVSAIEVDAFCVGFMNDRLGVRAVESDAPDAVLDREGRNYDAITLWHALEHMARPWEVVAACARSLAPGGVLIVAVPNPDSVQARWMGSRWPHYDLPRHLAHLSTGWLTARAEAAGLKLDSITTRDEGSLAVNTQSIPLWLLGLLRVSAEKGGLSRAAASLCWRGGRIAARLLAPWDAREGRGAAYTAVFRRPE